MDVALKTWLVVVIAVMIVYALRHWVLTITRLNRPQRPYYQDILDGELPGVSVLIPMHDEELVAHNVLDALLDTTYPLDRLEVIPIDDHSADRTREILERYAAEHPNVIRPLFRDGGERGKPAALNDGLEIATHEIVLVFDADYRPPRDMVRALAAGFQDPEVGAVMGRVVPLNVNGRLLTRLLDLERSGGYQVDQQARYTLDLVPQYGGTVGGFRKSLALSWGGFDPSLPAEDTDLTVRAYAHGWRVAYANRAECYEQVPETWDARFKQLRRWARGHTLALFHHWRPVLRSKFLSPREKVDALLVLGIYLVPPLMLSGYLANLLLFLQGDLGVWFAVAIGFFVVAYNAFGNFAPFFQVAAAAVLDGSGERQLLLPFLFFAFVFNLVAGTLGVFDAFLAKLRGDAPAWEKTGRYTV